MHIDETAIEAARGTGELRADHFVQLYEAAFEGLFRYALAAARDRQLAEDAVQECFLRYFLARTERQSIPNGKAWLYRVLRNLLCDLQKGTGARYSVGIEAALNQADRRQDPESDCRVAELSKNLSSMLTAREMECLRLRTEGLHYKEIAEALAIRQGTVGVLLGRAVRKLQKLLSPERTARCSKP